VAQALQRHEPEKRISGRRASHRGVHVNHNIADIMNEYFASIYGVRVARPTHIAAFFDF